KGSWSVLFPSEARGDRRYRQEASRNEMALSGTTAFAGIRTAVEPRRPFPPRVLQTVRKVPGTAMTTVDAAPESEVALARELMLFEYGTCTNSVQADKLYEHSSDLRQYLDKRWLTLAFDKAHKPCIRGTDYVGLLPFRVEDQPHLLLVAPKGSQQNENLGLLSFLQLLTLVNGGTPPDNLPGFEGMRGPHLFLLFLAHHYALLLGELCQRDFRSYYRAEEDDLRGRIRGRLNLSAYARRAVQGRPHILPCR